MVKRKRRKAKQKKAPLIEFFEKALVDLGTLTYGVQDNSIIEATYCFENGTFGIIESPENTVITETELMSVAGALDIFKSETTSRTQNPVAYIIKRNYRKAKITNPFKGYTITDC